MSEIGATGSVFGQTTSVPFPVSRELDVLKREQKCPIFGRSDFEKTLFCFLGQKSWVVLYVGKIVINKTV